MTPPGPELLERLSALAGIEPFYYDIWGNRHTTSDEARLAILSAMGIEASEEGLRKRLDARWLRLMEPTLVVPVNRQPSGIPIRFPLEEGLENSVRVRLCAEDEAGGKTLSRSRALEPWTPASSTECATWRPRSPTAPTGLSATTASAPCAGRPRASFRA